MPNLAHSLRLASAFLAVSLAAACSKPQPTAGGDAAQPTEVASEGQTVFAKCAACHSLEAGKNLLGPSLHNIVGRAAGTEKGFKYSEAMTSSGISWSEDKLDAYLTQPQKLVPGTRMSFPGISDAAQRKALIDYLKTAGK